MTKPKRRSAPATPRNVDKSVEKSSVPAQLKPFKPGIDARRGRGPAKGAPNAGRPPNEWKAEMESLADRWRIAAAAKGIADDPDHPMWMAVGKFAHEATKGKPAQAVVATVAAEVTVRFVSEGK